MAAMEYRAIIFNSARDGNLRRLRVFLEDRPRETVLTLLETKTFGTPPLVIAARNGHLDVVNYLISKGADLSATGTVTFDGETIEGAPAIWAASAAGHVEVTRTLLAAGADVNQTTASNSSALRGACYDGHLKVVRLLIDHGADVEIGNRHGHTPLMIAAYREKTSIVEYLLKEGANPNAVSSKGNTALHDAAEAGHVAIAQLLLDSGARIQRDEHGLTPMLSAAMIGHKNVVDLFRPMCTAEEQIDALKLLGATNVDKRRDISSAIRVWREAVMLQTKPDSVSNFEKEPKKTSHFELPIVYEQSKELDSEAYLDGILGDPDSLRMQALLIRERILGDRHPETHYFLRYRGAIYADVGQFERCFQLWTHALHLQQSCLEPLNQMTQATILAFAEIFGYILNERSLTRNAEAPMTLTSEHIVAVLEKAVEEIERGCGDPNSTGTDSNDDGCHGRMAVVCLYLVELIGRLESKKQLDETRMLRALRRLVRVGPRACDGSSPLHAACDEQSSAAGRYPTARFPSLFVVRRLITVGADVWTRDAKGNTPLHVVLRNKQPRLSIAKYLLAHGAPIMARSSDDLMPWSVIKSHPNMRNDIKPGRYLTLKGLAANAVRRARFAYEDAIPRDLLDFVLTH